ncbi:MAG: isoprenylcysteine carboxylmethyltransferase family protein [Bacteroidales bacterium]|jgi:protein-S-isoprenylcysteine O-methyltransferase Ste14|nr:isoprenylcysteine carboxylmethyltransferase family protein [Bacteroidales bacterium]
MALIDSFEKTGNFFFRYRGYIPVALCLIAIPAMFLSGNTNIFNSKYYLTLTIISISVSFIGEIIRAVTVGTTPKGTSGRNRKEQVAESLNTSGIYSIVRHPLYLANYLMWLGLLIFTANIFLIVVVSLLFFIYYERIMFAEEQFLTKKFGKEFTDWASKTPAFIPDFRKFKKSDVPLSFKTIIRREYSSVMAMALSFMFIDLLRYLIVFKELNFCRISVYVAGASVIIAAILSLLRHNTNLLNEEGRS